jgi:hypothetical protein
VDNRPHNITRSAIALLSLTFFQQILTREFQQAKYDITFKGAVPPSEHKKNLEIVRNN